VEGDEDEAEEEAEDEDEDEAEEEDEVEAEVGPCRGLGLLAWPPGVRDGRPPVRQICHCLR
jgi:hypothetical protein